MIKKRHNGDLKIAYRPYRIDEVIGNDAIKRMVSNGLLNNSFPHASLFTGPKGCGKTTFARIVALALNCERGVSPNPCCVCNTCKSIINMRNLSVVEVDAARTGNKAYITAIAGNLSSGSITGERNKVIIIDEAHKLTHDGEDILLKPMEDTPDNVYVILCTNKPDKLEEATRDRCRAGTIQFGRISVKYIYELLEQVAQFEGMEYKKDILELIADNSDGTPRTALGILQQVNNEGSWNASIVEMLCSVGTDVDTLNIFNFCNHLLNGDWNVLKVEFDSLKKYSPETNRIAMVSFFAGCLKRAKNIVMANKFSLAIDMLDKNYFSPKSEYILFNDCFKLFKIFNKE